MSYRIRTIKPEAWQSDQVCAVSRDARLLWLVLITMADDDGRFRWRPQSILGHGYPDDDDAAGLLPGWLDELVSEGLVTIYEHRRSTLGVHPNWRNHQRIDKPKASSLPGPADPESIVRDQSATRLGQVPPPSQDESREEGKGREGIGEEGMAAARAPAAIEPRVAQWLDGLFASGQAQRLPWATDPLIEDQQRQEVATLFAETEDPGVVISVMRDIGAAVREGKVRNRLPMAVRSFIGNAEAKARQTPGPHLFGKPMRPANKQAEWGEMYRAQAAKEPVYEGEVVE